MNEQPYTPTPEQAAKVAALLRPHLATLRATQQAAERQEPRAT